ncbi:MAG: AAA family ATPase [bacterium]|nr:AAA family ATPase [bacterium]
MFKRKIENAIIEYFKSKRETILVIDGARQVGKTFIIRHLSKKHFKNYLEINLKDDYNGEKIFSNIRTTRDFYIQVSSYENSILNDFDDTIIFLDEIQVYPHLLTMLKALNQDKKYTYIVSGSLLGITLKHTFIPMGSINELKMYPMDFEEFLWANNVGQEAINYLKECFDNLTQINESVHETFLKRFKEYLICGGMPDAVKEFVNEKNINKMRNVQQQTYLYYSDDCSQYDEEHKLHIRRIYEMMPSYMENKVKRLQINKIEEKEKERTEKYSEDFEYLIHSGIAQCVKAVSNPIFPLIESSSKNLMKLYFNDVGLLTNILFKNNVRAILDNDYGINLGSVYETVCATELISHGHELFYFDSKKIGEVDFLINDYDNLSILPIEIKSGKDQNNFRAIPKLIDENGNYKMKKGIVFGNKNILKKEGNLIILPVYLIMFV